MSTVSFKVDPQDLDNITKSLDGLNYKAPTVLKNAANATGKKALQMIYEYTDKEYAYEGKHTLSDFLKRKSATYANPRMIIDVKSQMNELIEFDVSNRDPLAWTDPASWVAGRVKKSSARTPIRNSGGNKAFVAEFKTGHKSVVARPGRDRRIQTVHAPSFTHMAMAAWDDSEDRISELLRNNIDKQIEKVMAHING